MLSNQWDKVVTGRYDVNTHSNNETDTEVLPFVSMLLMSRVG